MSEFIITYMGRKVFPFDIKTDDIYIEDVAHALANKCRFTGHTRHFYSVAQHCVLVGQELESYSVNPLWGLFHDAGEAYLPDVATGLKAHFSELIIAEVKILKAVRDKFRLPLLSAKDKSILKEIDTYVLYWEGRRLMPPHKEAMWHKPSLYSARLEFKPLAPAWAKAAFLEFYYKYQKEKQLKELECI